MSKNLVGQFSVSSDRASFDNALASFAIDLGGPKSGPDSTVQSPAAKTMLTSLNINYQKPTITNVSSNNTQQATAAKGQIGAGKVAICDGIDKAQGAVLAIAKAYGQDVNEIYPSLKSDDGAIAVSAALEATSGLGSFATFLSAFVPDVRPSKDNKMTKEQFKNLVKDVTRAYASSPSVQQKSMNQGPAVAIKQDPAADLAQFLNDGGEIEALLALDPKNPNIPEYRALVAMESAVDNRLEELGPKYDGPHCSLVGGSLRDIGGVKCLEGFNVVASAIDTSNTLNAEYKYAANKDLYGFMAGQMS